MSDSPRPTPRPVNSFEFVTIASARARQLLEGCVPRVEGSPKPARRALQEVAQGAVTRVEPGADTSADEA
jgi:DNA-directed RNA polymerase subunit K/omega